jgi:hypothetical protein
VRIRDGPEALGDLLAGNRLEPAPGLLELGFNSLNSSVAA